MQRLNLSLTRLRFPRAPALSTSRNTVLFHPAPVTAFAAPSRLFADAKLNMTLLKRLRDMTGAPLHTCKEAVTAACADASLGTEKQQLDAAVEFLRKKGVSSAAKKASRATSQGLLGLVSTPDNRSAVLVEVNCETDFVARNVTFQNFAAGVAVASLPKAAGGNVAVDDLTAAKLVLTDGSAKESIKEAMQQVIFSTGENVNVRRGTGLAVPADKHGVVAAYMHNTAPGHGFEGKAQLGRTAALVHLQSEPSIPSQELLDLGSKIAMHIVAINPLYLSKESVPAETLAKEKEIYLTEANNKAAGKPAHVLEKMVQGKLSKYFDETCLLEQQFVVNAEGEKPKKVREVLKLKSSSGAAVPVNLVAFARYSVGEGAESSQ